MSSVAFEKTGYAIRQNGQPMPVQFVRIDEDGRAEVLGPNGRTYSFNRDALATISEVEDLLQRDRVLEVASSYRFAEVPGMPARTVVCSHPTRKASSYVLTEGAGGMHCNCPAYAKSFGQTCKHIEAFTLLERAQEEAETRRAQLGKDRLAAEAAARAYRSNRPAAPRTEIKSEDW